MSDIIFNDTDTLSLVDKNNLQYHLQIVRDGRDAFLKVGESLCWLKNTKVQSERGQMSPIYRVAGIADNFPDLCENLGICKRHGYRLANAFKTHESIQPIVPNWAQKVNEGQLRELAKVPTEKRQEVIERTIEKEGKLTAASIKDMAQQLTEEREPEVVTATVESTAMQQAAKAISALLEVSTEDPMHDDAMRKVRQFCNRRLQYENA